MSDKPAFPTYQVGPDGLPECDWRDIGGPYVWLVYWYEMGFYEGDGLACALRPDGQVDIGSLSHCTCFGPAEHWPGEIISVEELRHQIHHDPDRPGNAVRQKGDYDYRRWLALGAKVTALLGGAETR